MRTDELDDYRRFTTPGELHKAVNSLRGLVEGIASDGQVGEDEVRELANWCSLRANLRDRSPFSELIPVVEQALIDDRFDPEERKDLLWLCGRVLSGGGYYDMATCAIQRLTGIVEGMLSDRDLSDVEIFALRDWLADNDYLMGTYPFDEMDGILTGILADGEISEDERNTLMAFMSTLVDFRESYNLSETEFAKLRETYAVSGVCACAPEISFEGKIFAFTGASSRAKRSEIYQVILDLGGEGRDGVSTKTDYLVVGDDGNPCWAYACYGRKIEKAVQLRKEGAKLQIVHENDFWDAAADAGYEVRC